MEFKFTEENFEAEVLRSDILTVVDFFADWCGPCKMMAPIVKELAEELSGKVKIGKLNVDEAPEISGRYRVMSIPTIIIFNNGEVVDTTVGSVSKAQLKEKIQSLQ